MANLDQKTVYRVTDLGLAAVASYGITAKGAAALQDARSQKSRGRTRQNPK